MNCLGVIPFPFKASFKKDIYKTICFSLLTEVNGQRPNISSAPEMVWKFPINGHYSFLFSLKPG